MVGNCPVGSRPDKKIILIIGFLNFLSRTWVNESCKVVPTSQCNFLVCVTVGPHCNKDLGTMKIIIITSFYIALFLLRSKRFTVSYYPGHRIQNQFCTQSALSPLPGEHSGQSPFYRRTHANPTTIPFASYRVPIYTPGSRAATWIKCLAEGQKYRATVGIEPGLSAWESSGHTTIPHTLLY